MNRETTITLQHPTKGLYETTPEGLAAVMLEHLPASAETLRGVLTERTGEVWEADARLSIPELLIILASFDHPPRPLCARCSVPVERTFPWADELGTVRLCEPCWTVARATEALADEDACARCGLLDSLCACYAPEAEPSDLAAAAEAARQQMAADPLAKLLAEGADR